MREPNVFHPSNHSAIMWSPLDYTVGWICAIMTEYVAAQNFLDERHNGPKYVLPQDNNIYTLGRVGQHMVVIAVLPDGEYGVTAAANIAKDMWRSFPNVKISLMVGIGGGVPSQRHDIRLGDIVVGTPHDGKGGLLQYDFDKTIQDQTLRIMGSLNQPPASLRAAVSNLRAQYEIEGHRLEDITKSVLEKRPKLKKNYKRPDSGSDRLYKSEVTHPPNDETICAAACGDDLSKLILRPERSDEEDNPAIHYGLIASANQLMGDASSRDRLAVEEDILCFDMGVAELMSQFPCLVIRGICDYSDSHKNKVWQGYAAMAAAAYAKDLICRIPPPNGIETETIFVPLLTDVLGSISRTEVNVARMRSRLDREEDLNILNWLTNIDYGPQQTEYMRMRQAGTGQWFLSSPQFKAWVKNNNQTLFCPGIPGVGKTIITSIVVDYLRLKSQNHSEIGIAYIYCNFRRQDEQIIDNLLTSLLKQLTESQPSLPGCVKDLYYHHKTKGTRPSLDEILRVISSVTTMYSKVYLIVDAIDECPASNGCRAKFLSELFNLQMRYGANIFATSRFIPEIVDLFETSVSLEIRANVDDVATYLEGHIGRLPWFVRESRQMQEEIKTVILEAIDGMFLLARIYLDFLSDKLTLNDVRSALEFQKRLQGSGEDQKAQVLAHAYEQTMERVKRQKPGLEKLAMGVLLWTTFAKRPLTASELRHALATKVGKSEFDEGNLPHTRDMVSVCFGLVAVDEESNIIRLVHYTVQEYLQGTQERWFPNAESEITTICLTYLSYSVFNSGFCQTDEDFEERLRSNPLYDYAAQNWVHHALEASNLCQDVINFLGREPNVAASYQALIAAKKPRFPLYSQEAPRQVTGLHLAVYFGTERVVNALPLQQRTLDSKDSDGRTPLSWAAEKGYETIVQQLLGRGADLESTDRNDRTPLSWAAENGHEDIVKLLLEKLLEKHAIPNHYRWAEDVKKMQEAIVRHLSSEDWGALIRAAKNGHEGTMQLLLEKVTYFESERNFDGKLHWFDSWSEYRHSPLAWAAENRHEGAMPLLLEKLFEKLLEKGANLESKDWNGRTPLLWIAENGHEAVVQWLLKKGANVESKDENNWTPLSWAAKNGHEVVVQRLLERGADSESKDWHHRTPLSWAAEKGHEAVVQWLLEKGANIESKDKNGWTPLSWAAKNGHEVVVQRLLERGADSESKDCHHRTPLSWAAEKGHGAVVQLLLEKDVDLESEDISKRTPLSWAAGMGCKAVAQHLLEKNASLETKDKNGWTPLSWAAEKEHEAVVQLLLGKGPDLESKDKGGRTLLSRAAEKGREAVVQLLLKEGADLESGDKDGRTPLSWAAERGCEAVVQRLLEKGADTEAKDSSGRTPLSLAIGALQGADSEAKVKYERVLMLLASVPKALGQSQVA